MPYPQQPSPVNHNVAQVEMDPRGHLIQFPLKEGSVQIKVWSVQNKQIFYTKESKECSVGISNFG